MATHVLRTSARKATSVPLFPLKSSSQNCTREAKQTSRPCIRPSVCVSVCPSGFTGSTTCWRGRSSASRERGASRDPPRRHPRPGLPRAQQRRSPSSLTEATARGRPSPSALRRPAGASAPPPAGPASPSLSLAAPSPCVRVEKAAQLARSFPLRCRLCGDRTRPTRSRPRPRPEADGAAAATSPAPLGSHHGGRAAAALVAQRALTESPAQVRNPGVGPHLPRPSLCRSPAAGRTAGSRGGPGRPNPAPAQPALQQPSCRPVALASARPAAPHTHHPGLWSFTHVSARRLKAPWLAAHTVEHPKAPAALRGGAKRIPVPPSPPKDAATPVRHLLVTRPRSLTQ